MVLLLRKCTVSLSSLNLTRHNYSAPFQTFFFSSSANVSVPNPTADFLTTMHHFSPETSLNVSSAISHLINPHKTYSMLSYLKETGFSAPQIDWMINKHPRILNVNTQVVKEKLSVLQDKGFSTQDTIHIVSKIPRLLCRTSGYRIGQSIATLKSVLGSTDAVSVVLKKFPWFLESDLGKNMIPNIEFLEKQCELSSSQVAEYVMRYPRFFLLQPKSIEETARRLDKMGFRRSSKMYLNAVRVVCSMSEEKLDLKMRLFRGIGLSENDVIQVFRRCSNVFGCSEKNIKDTMEVLLRSGKFGPSFSLTDIELLRFSLEKRIKPRLEVVKALEERGLWPKKPSLSSILQMSHMKFLERFVLSNSNALGDHCVNGFTKKLALDSVV